MNSTNSKLTPPTPALKRDKVKTFHLQQSQKQEINKILRSDEFLKCTLLSQQIYLIM